MAQGGRVEYTIGFNVDKSGLNDIKKQLKEINTMTAKEVQLNNPSLNMNEAMSALKKAQIAAGELEKAMNQAFNPKLGVTNLEKLQASLNRLNLNDIQQRFSAIGVKGEQAFLNIAKSALTTNVNLKQTSKFIDKIGTTLVNTVKWQFSSSLVNRFTGAVQQAVGYVEHLDSSLNDIRIVTGKSADEMERFAVKANKAAQELGKATTDYTEASLIFYQQGLGDEEVAARAETTLKASNVTGQSTAAVSEELTAVWNGYKVATEDTEAAVDKLAAVAATTASDLQELSTGMSKVASAANSMGVDMDQLNAQIATIISVTRQAPESVGTALKTIYARLADLKLGETDEDGLGLGDVSGTLQKVGIEVLDVNGDLREMGDVIEEVAAKWDTWTSAQQAAIAQSMAGKRQYNNLVALFDNWDMYSSALETSKNSIGILQNQQDIYMESTEAHLQMLKTEWEDLYDSVIDESAIKGVSDGLRGILNIVTNIIDGLGGGKTLITGLVALIGTKFGKQIGQVLNPFIENIKNAKTNAAQLQMVLDNIAESERMGHFGSESAKAMSEAQKEMSQYWHLMTEEEINASQEAIREIGTWTQRKEEILATENQLKDYIATFNNQSLNKGIEGKSFFTGQPDKGTVSDSIRNDLSERIEKNQRQLALSYDKTTKAIKAYGIEQDKINKKDTTLVNQIGHLKKGIKDLKKSFDIAKKASPELINTEDLAKAEAGIKKIEARIKAFEQGDHTVNFNGLDAELASISKVSEMAGEKYNLFLSVLRDTGSIEKANAAIKTYEDSLNKNVLKLQLNIETVSQFIGALSSLAFSLQSIINLPSIWTNEDLSAGEKMLQTVTALGMAFPGLIAAYNGIDKILGPLIAKKTVDVEVTGEEAVAEGAAAVASGVKATADTGEAVAEAAVTAGTWAHVKALIAEKAAMLANPVGIAIAGLVALAATLSIVSKAREKHIEKIKEENEEIIKRNEEEQEVIKSNIDASNSLKELTKEYYEGNISQREYNDRKAELIGNLDQEAQYALTVAQSYDEAAAALDKYNRRQTERSKEEATGAQQAALYNMIQGAGGKGEGSWYIDSNKYENDIVLDYSINGNTDLVEALTEAGLGNVTTSMSGTPIFRLQLDLDDEDVVEKFKSYQGIISKFSNLKGTDMYDELAGELRQMTSSEAYSSFLSSSSTLETDELTLTADDLGLSSATIKDAEDKYSEFIAVIQQKQEEGIIDSSRSAFEIASEYIGKLGNSALNAAIGFETIKEHIIDLTGPSKELVEGWEKSGQGVPQWVTDQEQRINEIIQYAQDNGLYERIKLLSDGDWQEIVNAGEGWQDALNNALTERYDDYITKLRENIALTINQTSDDLKGVLDSAITNDLSATDENYTKMVESVQQLKEAYPELTDEIETFSTAGLVGTEHWIQVTYKLQQAIDGIEFNNLTQKSKDALKNLNDMFGEETVVKTEARTKTREEVTVPIIPDDTEFQEAIDNILDAEYEIDVEVHADAERDFTQLVSSLEQADSMADKIGEDFIVAADDIRELNQAFPGILQGIEYLGDGTIKLNEEIARSAMAAAADEEAASTQALITKLQNSADELRAKADIYDAQADIAAKANAGIINSDKAKTDIAKNLSELETENDKIATQTEIDNAALVADNSSDNAYINAENWTKSYQAAADASAKWANAAIKNAQSVANGGGPVSNGGNFGVTFTGKNGVSSEANSGTGWQNSADAGNWGDVEQQFRDMAEAARAEANDIEGMIVAAAAKGTESLKKTGDAGKSSGSGGGGSEKEADHEEYLEREEDIYHEINKELEQIESTLGRIQKLEDHSWGASATANLEEENKLLDKQLEKLQEKKGMQESDLSVRRKQLENSGFTFSDDGSVINNSEAQLNALYAHYNQMVDAYNAMSAAEQETYKQELEAEKDRIDKIENKISEYESTYSDYQSVLDEIMDKHFEQIEKQVQAFNQDIEIHLELDEAKKEWTDFWYDIVQDMDDSDFAGQISKSVDKLKLLVGVGADATKSTVAQLTGHLNETITQVQAQIASANRGGEDSMFGDDSALSKETLEDYKKKLMDALTEAKQELDNISDSYLGILDQAQEKIDKQVEGWEAISSHLDHNAKLIKMISGEKSYDSLNNMYEKQYENNLKLINTQKQSKEFWQQQMESERKQMEAAEKGSKDYKTHEEAYKKASENFRKAVSDLDSTVEEALEKLKEWRDNQLAAINDTMDKAISGGQGLDTITREWKLINDYSSAYLDNVERATEMEGLNKEFEKVLNTTNLTAEAQQKLNKMRDDEIKRLNEKNKLTQFDIDEVKARLEIRKQELALEDAQKNKSNLRLRRDSQGNYSYQYTGDDKAIEDAEGGVLNAKKDWWELVKKYQNDATSNYLDNLAKVNEIKKEMDQAEIDGDKQKYEALKAELIKYEEIVDFWAQESENSKRLLFQGTAEFFADIEDAEILPQWETTVSKMIDNWNNGGKDSFIGAVQQGIEDTELLQNEFAARTKEILDEAGVNYHSLKEDGIDPTTDALQDMVDTNEDLADTLEDINDLLGEQAEKLKDCEDSYNSLKQAAVDAIDEANRMIEELARTVIRSNQQVQASIQAAQNASSIWGNGGYSGGNGGSGGGGGGGSYPGGTNAVTQGGRYTLTMTDDKGGHSSSTYGDKSELKRKAKEAVARGKRISLYDRETKKLVTVNPDEYYKVRESKIDSFKTGGYTGIWNDDIASGKLAVLHQKELVLNETDTNNILKAVELLRNIAIDKIANSIISAAQASASILNGINSGAVQNMANSITNETDNSYRNTTINADFSGVRSADAIYEALRNLENASMQSVF